jgi:hypothetical protein
MFLEKYMPGENNSFLVGVRVSSPWYSYYSYKYELFTSGTIA